MWRMASKMWQKACFPINQNLGYFFDQKVLEMNTLQCHSHFSVTNQHMCLNEMAQSAHFSEFRIIFIFCVCFDPRNVVPDSFDTIVTNVKIVFDTTGWYSQACTDEARRLNVARGSF